jgi:hypothetical protein
LLLLAAIAAQRVFRFNAPSQKVGNIVALCQNRIRETYPFAQNRREAQPISIGRKRPVSAVSGDGQKTKKSA